MKKMVAAALLALASTAQAGIAFLDSSLQVGNDGSVANPYDFGALDGTPSLLTVTTFGAAGGSFEEYANFSIAQSANVAASANTYALSFLGIDLLDIDNLTIELWDGSHPAGSSLLGTFSGDNITTALGTLGAGQYHLDISGTFGSNAVGGQYSIAMAAVPAIPEPETYALMLAGLGAVAFVVRRRRVQP